eukprot:6139687-Lingulodinium_polyedra.AAC.1
MQVQNAREEALLRWYAQVRALSRGGGPGCLPELAILKTLSPIPEGQLHAACVVQQFHGGLVH